MNMKAPLGKRKTPIEGCSVAIGVSSLRASESQLAAKFGSPVSITENKTGKGHLSIDFASPDELNRILDLLGVNLDY